MIAIHAIELRFASLTEEDYNTDFYAIVAVCLSTVGDLWVIACSLCNLFTVSGLTVRGCSTNAWALLIHQQTLFQVTRALLRAARKLCVHAPELCLPGFCTQIFWQAAQSNVNRHSF